MTKKILIVEDEQPIIDLLKDVFRTFPDYDVSVAIDGEKALLCVKDNPPDLILLDFGIPKISGYDVCEKVKKDKTLSNVKIIILSGMAQDTGEKVAAEVQADLFMAKPFSLIGLETNVRSLLDA